MNITAQEEWDTYVRVRTDQWTWGGLAVGVGTMGVVVAGTVAGSMAIGAAAVPAGTAGALVIGMAAASGAFAAGQSSSLSTFVHARTPFRK